MQIGGMSYQVAEAASRSLSQLTFGRKEGYEQYVLDAGPEQVVSLPQSAAPR